MNRTEAVIRRLVSQIGERPVGSDANNEACLYLAGLGEDMGYETHHIPFECLRWDRGPSSLRVEGREIEIHGGPFSPPLDGSFDIEHVSTVEELRDVDMQGKLLFISGPLAADPLMPKDFPLYYPDEHKEIIDLIEKGAPAGIVAFTGKHPLCGLDPYPLFEDGGLGIANAFAREDQRPGASKGDIYIESSTRLVPSRQLVFSRDGASARRVILCAHMDTKYGTPGALDNGAGVATLVGVMERLRGTELPFSLDIVPFNGEEHFAVPGQLAYLEDNANLMETTALVINIDGVSHGDSRSAFSYYNLEKRSEIDGIIEEHDAAIPGEPWIAGDHAIFAFRNIPCIAVTSSNLMETVLDLTHTKEDRLDKINFALLEDTADIIADILRSLA